MDVDGNVVLDLHCNFSNLPLGYNHESYVNVSSDGNFDDANRKDKAISTIVSLDTE